MGRRARAYRGAKRQKEKVRQARQDEKRRRKLEKRRKPDLLEEAPGPEATDTPPESPQESPET